MTSSIESNLVTELGALQCYSEENTLSNVTRYCITIEVKKCLSSIGLIILTDSRINSIV